jgi:hypothetical protein
VRKLLLSVLAITALLATVAASAKEFQPGDLRICNKTRCEAIVNRDVLRSAASFYYVGPCPPRVRGVRLGAPYYELRFRNGYVTGIVATRQLDRFLTYGVHDQQFARDKWYAVPGKLSNELKRLTVDLRPLYVTRAALARSIGVRRRHCR